MKIRRSGDHFDPAMLEWLGHRRGPQTIVVIDTPPKPEPKGPVQRVPFGFGVRPKPVEVEPQLWEGDQA